MSKKCSQGTSTKRPLLEQSFIFISVCSTFIIVWCFLFSLGYIGAYLEFPLDFYFFINHASLTSAAIPVIFTTVAAFFHLVFTQASKAYIEPQKAILFIAAFPLLIYWLYLPSQIDNTLHSVKIVAGKISRKHIIEFIIIPLISFSLLCICFGFEAVSKSNKDQMNSDWEIIRKTIIILSMFFAPFFDGTLYSLKKLHSPFLSCIITRQHQPIHGIVLYTNSSGIMLYTPSMDKIIFHYSDEVSKIIFNCGAHVRPAPLHVPLGT